jgi:drug/metabolite transporter (DMT)-like permease
LLTNFEIVATTIIALIVFKETISQRLWIAISLIMVASIVLGLESFDALSFSSGSLLVLLATCCWGMENNVTRKLATKNTYQIVIIKGVFSGLGSLIVALVLGDALPTFIHLLITLMLGLITYGISIFLYVRAQRTLGASQTSAYYAITPFIGALLGLFLNQETFNIQIIIAFAIMIIATIMTIRHTLKHHHKQ